MSVSLDYLSALVKWVASTLMVQFFCHYSAVVFYFKKKKNVNVKVIFATFYCKLIYFCINIYLIEQVEVKIVDSTTADACVTC